MKKHTKIVIILLATMPVAVGAAVSGAGDRAAGKAVFEAKCRTCHAALPYTGRVGNLTAFLANPQGYNPKTAMTFRGLRSRKDIDCESAPKFDADSHEFCQSFHIIACARHLLKVVVLCFEREDNH